MGLPQIAESQGNDLVKKFGVEDVINVYPGNVSTSDWVGLDEVLVPDLNESAIYQKFDAKNSAYIQLVEPVLVKPVTNGLIASSSDNSVMDTMGDEVESVDATAPVTSVETSTSVEPEPEPVVETVPEAPVDDSAIEPTEDTAVYKKATESVLTFFSQVTQLFPLLNNSTTTPTEEVSSVDDSTDLPAEDSAEDFVEVNDADLTNEVESVTESVDTSAVGVGQIELGGDSVAATSSEEVVVSLPINSATTSNNDFAPEETVSVASSSLISASSTDEEVISTTTPKEETVMDTSTTLPESFKRYSIEFSDFSIPDLKSGESITSIQLRASFGAKYDLRPSTTAPFFELKFNSPSTTYSVGTVLVDDEVSNAINGGYQLFALPQDLTVDDLKNISITVDFVGDKEELDGAFIDALWFEIDTIRVTKQDLEDRTSAEVLKTLKGPAYHQLVSNKFDFGQDENILFNLKYLSQRSKPVEAIRQFLGQSKIKIKKVEVLHQASGLVGVRPDITVTSAGLVTIVIPETEKKNMKPGRYTIELEVDEGGVILRDSFDFQWGMLTINPDKSTGPIDTPVDISMGALTPNGNTICGAPLRLYHVSPSGFINELLVTNSAKCNGNNVIDEPDYTATIIPVETGTHELYLERLNDNGEVVAHTVTDFITEVKPAVRIERVGPTRIYPPAPYDMTMTVMADKSFSGTLKELVPKDFTVFNTNAKITTVGAFKELTWSIDLLAGDSETVSYSFDAPDVSPYLYELGPASLTGKGKANSPTQNQSASSTVSTTTVSNSNTTVAKQTFVEHRKWQIASDATGNMIIYYDGTGAIPTGWTCLSCGSGTFFQRFAVGSSTYNNTGGSNSHTPTAIGSLTVSSDSDAENFGSGVVAGTSHTHTLTPSIGAGNNLPAYRQLRVLQYSSSTGEAPQLPVGAIGIFDISSSSLPANWLRYDVQDGYYLYGEDVPGTASSSDTHTHVVGGTTGVAAGTNVGARGGTPAGQGATDDHTHTISTTTADTNHEPPYVEVVLARLTATSTPPNNLITMWTDSVPSGWVDVSSDGAAPFNNKFIKASSTYGTTGGTNTHTHSNISGVISSGPTGGAVTTRSGTAGAAFTHTHSVSVTSFSTSSNLPPYVSVIFGERQGTNPVYTQNSFRWYVNENAEPSTNPWPPDAGTDLIEGENIDGNTTPVADGDVLRLRLNVGVINATTTVGSTFRLEYAEANTCSLASTWTTVGDSASTTVWRGYNNSLTDHDTLSSTVLASTTVAATYEESGIATGTPNQIDPGDYAEWDFVLEHNGATAGTNYCFRLVEGDGSAFSTYTVYPQVLTNSAPIAPTLSVPFDNEKTASTSLDFRFVTTDPESEDIHYQVQIDNNYDFSSTLEDRNSISNSAQFENLVVVSDKAPFTSGQLMKFSAISTFTNGTTYYWRVRSRDPNGSGDWGSWSTPFSFTVDTSLLASAWFQTEDEQFNTGTLTDVATGSDQVVLGGSATSGTLVSPAINFSDGDRGTAWGNLIFNDTETAGDIKYTLQYYTDAATWSDIPDSDLSGNSAGFDTPSTVPLLDLNTDDYGTIRIIATLTNSGGSPSLQDWTIEWGYRVETPTISKLFANEKTGTTTPIFEFTTTDPQADDLTYQISWSVDYDFAASTTRDSTNNPAGFSNLDNGGDADPFNSGDTIQYTVQAADTLSNDTTYWWRVRAKDTTGDDAWSFWTDPQSFTVATDTVASTWFQTTEEQFDTNVLSGTDALANDTVSVATTATEAIIVYGEGTASTPKYRQWNGSAWGSEGDMSDIGAALVWSEVKAGTTREEYVAATVDTQSDLNVQVFSLGAWGNLQELSTNVGSISSRGFDIAYETQSGDAMVVYCNNAADPEYYTWDGSSWTAGSAPINVAETTNCAWIQLASDPASDEIVMLMRGTDGSPYEAWVWNGSTWGNSTTLGGITEASHEGMAVEYEESGGQAVIVVSDGNPARFRWNSWNGTAWGTAATQALEDDFEWGTLVKDIGSDEMALCYQDEDTNIGTVRWTGTAWATYVEHLTTTGKAKTDPGFACAFENDGARDNYIMTVFTDTDSTDYTFWNNTTWSTAATINTIGDTITSKLERTGTGELLGVFFDETNDDLLFSYWNGTGWATTTTLENDGSVDTTPYGYPYAMAPRNDGKAGTVVVSPAINFDDGSGPYWQEMSWVDSQPGTSEILYSVQYQTATGSWAFIPDSEIPGNSSGTTTSPIDLSGLNKNTYNVIRPYAALTCDASNNCPSIQDWTVKWAEGLTISGTLYDYNRTNPINGGTIAVAVNGTVQAGKTSPNVNGVWSISNVTVFPGDIVTVFVNSTSSESEAVGVTLYDGFGDIAGLDMFQRHVSLGSNDATSTPITNADIGLITYVQNEDIFLDYSTTTNTLDLCGDTGCNDVRFYINASTTYSAGGNLLTHDLINNGTFIATTSIYVDGSWDNNATTTLTGSSVYFTATSTNETIDTTGAGFYSFNDVGFGTTTGNATWTLASNIDINGDLAVDNGTLARGSLAINVTGNLTNGSGGYWTGIGTTTFDGSGGSTWSDSNATLQNVGNVLIDATNKVVTLGGNVAANNLIIGADDTLDASASHYDITIYGDWTNNNSFAARNGTVFFSATTSGHVIDAGGDAFYDLTFNGVGGDWSFIESTLSVGNDFTISTGTVTMTTATTSIAGSFSSVGGTFAHNNSAIDFTGAGTETIAASGTAFTNAFYDLYFSGGGNWTMTDQNATSSNNVTIVSGDVTFPSGTFTISGSLQDSGGSFTANNGTVKLDSVGTESILAGGSSLFNLLIDGSGSFSFVDTDADIDGDLTVNSGTLTLPSGTLNVGGSVFNGSTITPNGGLILFDSTDTGETIDFGTSDMYDVRFENETGGWTISAHATTTNDFVLASSSNFTLADSQVLSVGGDFTNLVGGASTTWTNTILSLETGSSTINTKSLGGDVYSTLRIGATAQIKMWNSSASTYDIVTGGGLYSMDHAATDGELYIFGDYVNSTNDEYWSYATDWDGSDLSGGSERQANVRFASGATAVFDAITFEAVGTTSASTTVANQGAGTYTVSISGGTTTATYYDWADLGLTGLTLTGSTSVTNLAYGHFTVAADGGTALTVSSTTIDTKPAYQIYNVGFATSTAITANNVTQSDGTPGSYWWFRNSYGNIGGEGKDNDTGNPGSIRWDDSALNLTISGVVYDTDETTPLGGTTCDGDADTPIRVVVEGGNTYDGTCAADGSFSVAGVTVVGDPTITVFLNNTPGGEKAVTVTKTATADITDLDLYVNRTIVRHEDVEPMTIDDMAAYDVFNDSDILFAAATGTTDTLVTAANSELHVWATTTFTPGGPVTLSANATGNSYDGSLHLGAGATFVGAGTTTYIIGGSITAETGATFVPASTTVVMTATTTGKTITTDAAETITVNVLQFTGVGGGWNLNGNLGASGDIYMSTGTLTGTGDINLSTGSFYGNGLVSLGGGEVSVDESNTLGGTQEWTFNDLTLGDGFATGTTTPGSNATTTIGGVLTISTAHFLDAGASAWNFTGTGSVFVENGTYLYDTSSVTYSGTAAMNVLSTDYYDLNFNAAGGSPTYTATGLGIQVFGDLSVGGASTTVVTFATNDPALNVDGDMYIYANGTFTASDSGSFTLAGSYDNDGTYNASGGTLTLDGSGAVDIAAGSSDFAALDITGPGDFTVSEHATATTAFTVGSGANSFTLSSGQTLAVVGTFSNELGGAATTWTGSTLYLLGGGNYEINASTTADSYDALLIGDLTEIRMWNSSASTVSTLGTGSVYSMDHANTNGDLYIYGDYNKTAGTDHWSYATDFDGTSLSGGGERQVNVYVEGSGSVLYEGAADWSVLGTASASTTIQNQGSGTYSLTVAGGASTTLNYYNVTDLDADGLTFTASPTVNDISYGVFTVVNDLDSAITVGGTVIDANPAKTFTKNIFNFGTGVTVATNTTATGTSVSSWRFTNHAGDFDGEGFDEDPDGDPGYLVWDDSAASITISGTVYTGEGSGTPGVGVCNDILNAVNIVVAGLTTYNATCGTGTGDFSVSGISYSPGDSIIAYLTPATGEEGATVTIDPVSNISNFDIYWNRVIVRHEGTNPITIADMAVYDSSDDANIPFTAVDSSPDTLTLPTDRKLIVWTNKEFAPGGNVTLSNGGVETYGGTLELDSGSTYTAAAGETLSIGGSLISQAGATYDASTATTTFTTTGSGRTIDINDGSFYNVQFTGSGDWAISDTIFDINNYEQSGGSLTLPSGTTTISGYFTVTGGSFTHNGSLMVFDATTAGNTITLNDSDTAELQFTGSGSWTLDDTNATATNNVTVSAGMLTMPSGSLTVEGSFRNEGGTITHNSGEIILSTTTTATLLASSSDLYSVTFRGGADYDMVDDSLTLAGNLVIDTATVTLATSTLSIGGSLDAAAGVFLTNSTGTILFNSSDTGETIDPGANSFYNVVFGNASGGWTITASATTTNNFTLTTASDFTLQSGTTLYVGGVFDNSVGGAATTWTGSTLILDSATEYAINAKTDNGDDYETLVVGNNSDISAWNSQATTTDVALSSSFYSQDNAGVDGDLYIYGDYHIGTTTEYWSYATDFDGTDLTGGSERAVTVAIASGATTTLDGGALNIIGASGNETTITNQGSGTYDFNVTSGTWNAQYYAFRNLNASGLSLSGTPTILSLNYGDFELAVGGGRLIDLSSTTLNANASLIITGARFATTTAITGTNVYLTGNTSNAWTFVSHTGNLDGENFDVDGVTSCGQVRWDDSSCLLTQQTHYRWRNDDGGLGAPDTEWYDASWLVRKPVRVDNNDATEYTNAVVELTVLFDSDMQTDFDDLRFTDDDGTTIIPHFIASSTNSVAAEVWVKVPTIPSSDTATIYMYYSNAVATSSSSSTLTFIAADDFEDGNISEYSGANDDKSLFSVDGSFAYGGSNGLDNTSNESARADDGGMARFDQTIGRGQTIRYMQYVDTNGGDDEVCTMFGVQSPVSNNQNYAVCAEQVAGTDYVSLVKDVVDTPVFSGEEMASSTLTWSNGWYEFEIDWATTSILVSVYDDQENLIATTSSSSPAYSSGGYGFTYWSNEGGWDNFSVRPTLATEPTIRFGAEVGDGGASWAGAQDTAVGLAANETLRLRLAIENSGLLITAQNFDLEYAAKGASPSCEAVSGASYATVPNQASCGTSPICMQSSTNYANGAATADLLTGTEGAFVAGQAIESPANTTSNLDIDQNEFTELEYAIVPTNNASSSNYCLRVTNSGTELDTYLRVAELTVRFDPVLGTVYMDERDGLNDLNLNIIGGTTTRVYATSTVSDQNGYTDLVSATTTFYHSDATAACVADDNNCYISTTDNNQCSFTNCSGNSCLLECYADFEYHASPTDNFGGKFWYAFMEVADNLDGTDFDTSIGQDLTTLAALDVANSIGYGSLEVASNTGSFNPTTTIQNIGNSPIDIDIVGSDMTDTGSSIIPASKQIFATSTFDYSSCGLGVCTPLSTTTISSYELDLIKPTSTAVSVEDVIYWGIEVPFGVASNPHTGINTFYATPD